MKNTTQIKISYNKRNGAKYETGQDRPDKNFIGYDLDGKAHDLQLQGKRLYKLVLQRVDGKLEKRWHPVHLVNA